jgi:hypothetical protein
MEFRRLGILAVALAIAMTCSPVAWGAPVCDPFVVFFLSKSTTLSAEAKFVISQVPAVLAERPGHVQIEGHSDGSEGEDLTLSERRADAVKDELIRLGVETDAIEAKGYGFAQPSKETASGTPEPVNSRVVILVPCAKEPQAIVPDALKKPPCTRRTRRGFQAC